MHRNVTYLKIDYFKENANMELRVNAQIENCKKEIRNRVDNLISQLDLLANELETEIESEKKGLKRYQNVFQFVPCG